jgi:hypothetical protein
MKKERNCLFCKDQFRTNGSLLLSNINYEEPLEENKGCRNELFVPLFSAKQTIIRPFACMPCWLPLFLLSLKSFVPHFSVERMLVCCKIAPKLGFRHAETEQERNSFLFVLTKQVPLPLKTCSCAISVMVSRLFCSPRRGGRRPPVHHFDSLLGGVVCSSFVQKQTTTNLARSLSFQGKTRQCQCFQVSLARLTRSDPQKISIMIVFSWTGPGGSSQFDSCPRRARIRDSNPGSCA